MPASVDPRMGIRTRFKHCVTGGVVIAHLLSSRITQAGGCEKDADCKGDRICENALCVAPASNPEPTPKGDATTTHDASVSPPSLGEALPSRTASVRTSFASLPGSAFEVSVEDADGPKRCVAPCSLQLSPGAHLVEVRGARTFSTKVEVPAAGGSFDIQTATRPSRSTPTVVLVVGVALLGAGIYGATQENLLLGLTGILLGTPATTVSLLMLATSKSVGSDAVTPHNATVSRATRHPVFVAAPTRDGVVGAVRLSF